MILGARLTEWERALSSDLEHYRENDGIIRLGGITDLVVAHPVTAS